MADVVNINNKTIAAKDATIVESTPVRSQVIDSGTDVVVVATTVGPNTIPYFDEEGEYVAKPLGEFGDVLLAIPQVTEAINDAANTAATEAATKAAEEVVGLVTEQAKEYRDEAEQFKDAAAASASAAQNIADANTYYITPSDPTGTIAGLAGTPSGSYFRVMQGAGVSPSQVWYRNDAGTAVRVADAAGQKSVDDLTVKVASIESFRPSFNLFNKDKVVDGYYLFESTGVPTVNALYCYSDYIEVAANSQYSSRTTTRVATFYDANKNYLSDVASSTIFKTPATAKYVRLSVAIANKALYQLTFGTGSEVYRPYLNTVNSNHDNASVSLIPAFGFASGKNKFNKATAQQGMHIGTDGTVISDADVTQSVSALIPVDNTKTYFCNQQYRMIAFYDAFGVFISRNAISNWNTLYPAAIVFPAGTFYIRIEMPNAVITGAMVSQVADNGKFEDYVLKAPALYINTPLQYQAVDTNIKLFNAGINLFNVAAAVKGYINEWSSWYPIWPDTGTQYVTSEMIAVTAGSVYTGNYIARFINFYDSNFMPLSSAVSSASFTVPAGAAYVRVTVNNTQGGTYILIKGAATPVFETYKQVLKETLDNGNKVVIPGSVIDQSSLQINFVNQGLFKIGKNLYNKATVLPGYINESGSIVAGGTSFAYSDFIKVEQSTTYTPSVGLRFVALYDANKNFLSTIVGVGNTITTLLTDANTYYVRLTVNYAWKDTLQFEKGATSTAYEEYQYTALSIIDGIPVSYTPSTVVEAIPDFYKLERLREFHMRTTKKKFNAAEVLRMAFFGDSYTRGQTRYALKVANYMWNRYNGTSMTSIVPPYGYGYRSFGWDPNGDNSDIVGTNVAQTGFTCQYNTGNGPDISSVTSSTAGHTISTPLDSSAGYDVYLYFEGGAGVITVTYPNTPTPESLDLSTYAAGLNIVKLSPPVAGSGNLIFTVVSGTVRLYGLDIEKPDANTLILHKLGGSGSNSRQWAAVDSTRFIAAVSGLAPDFCSIMLGTNDQGSALTYAEFKANILTMIDRIRTARPTTDILLICPAENNRPGGNTVPITRYAQAMYDIAKNDRDVAFLNLQSSFGAVASDYAYGSNRPWMVADNIHPDPNTGGYAIAGSILRALGMLS